MDHTSDEYSGEDLDIINAVRSSIDIQKLDDLNPHTEIDAFDEDKEGILNNKTSLEFIEQPDDDVERDTFNIAEGQVNVYIRGDRSKPAILAIPGLGLTYRSCFKGYVHFPGNSKNFNRVCLYVLELPGLSQESRDLDPDFIFSPDVLVSIIDQVVQHYGLVRFIGMGAGFGGTALLHYALRDDSNIRGIILFGSNASQLTWSEWFTQRGSSISLNKGRVSDTVKQRFMNYWFSPNTVETDQELISAYGAELHSLNPFNLAKLVDASRSKPDINIQIPHLKCKAMIFNGKKSVSYEQTVDLFGNYGNELVSYLEVPDSGSLVCVENPGYTIESFHLFLYSCGV
eukprot:TRINITY_DN3600_c0_g1_i1.p1 TRINITY_DN3600_c0_g1~~TRINITY_DN3600_c0_g1_i1.p1  ORF type:complete len:356 (-),score=72.19 TRINITY_DN3600_c0_g1_i1:55-1083(-)